MTRAGVNSLISAARDALEDGDCAAAQATLARAWSALGQYSAGLAARGASTGTALSLHRSIVKVQNAIGRACVTDTYISPSGQTTGRNPDLLAPSFHGTGDVIFTSLQTTLTTLGIIGAVFGLGYGVYMTYKGRA